LYLAPHVGKITETKGAGYKPAPASDSFKIKNSKFGQKLSNRPVA